MSQEKMQAILNFWEGITGQEIIANVTGIIENHSTNKTIARDLAIIKVKDKLGDKFAYELIDIALQIVLGRLNNTKTSEWHQTGFFTKKGLEQATHPQIAKYHASKYLDCDLVYDICCGLGFDSFAISQVAMQVIAIEQDPLTAAFCLYNSRLQGINNIQVVCASAEDYVANQKFQINAGIWSDPDRRSENYRVRAADEAAPSLEFLSELECRGPVGVKLSPLANVASTFWKKEFIGYANECKEQILWRNIEQNDLQVRLIDHNCVWNQSAATTNTSVMVNDINVGSYLLEPHSVLVASGLLDAFYLQENTVYLPSARIAIADSSPKASAWQTIFKVLKVVPFRPKDVNRIITELNWSSNVAIKKSGVKESAEQIRSQLKFCTENAIGNEQQVIFVTVLGQKKIAIFCERV